MISFTTPVKKIKKALTYPLVVSILLGHFIFALVIGVRALGQFQQIELYAYDLMSYLHAQGKISDQRITFVEYKDEDEKKYWPLSDEHLSIMLERLLAYKPAVIGFDLYRDKEIPSMDGSRHLDKLNHILTSNPNIIVITRFATNEGVSIAPPEVLKGSNQVGFNDFYNDGSGIIRRGMLFMDDGVNYYDYFGLKVALKYLEKDKIWIEPVDERHPELLRLGKVILSPLEPDFGAYVNADTAGYQFMMTYPYAPAPYNSMTLSQAIEGTFDPKLVIGKILIVGKNAESTPDFHYTPISRWDKIDPRTPGAVIHCYAISQLLDMALKGLPPLKTLKEPYETLWIWVWCLAGALICLWSRSFVKFSLAMVLGLALLVSTVYIAFINSYWVISVTPATGWIMATVSMMSYLSLLERKQKQFIKSAFGQYLSPKVIDEIMVDPEKLCLGGDQRVMTAFFSDIQGFSTISEKLTPQELVQLLNEYLTEMCNIIVSQQGTIDKFEGDAIIAFWGAPLQHEDHARRACFASIDIQKRLAYLNEEWKKQAKPVLRTRIGLNSDMMVVGNMGSVQRMNYTIMGDAVNLASRLEGINKFYRSYSMISDKTYQLTRDDVDVREMDTIKVVGKLKPVVIYELLDKKNSTSGDLAQVVELYAKGLEKYRGREFEKAIAFFEKALAVFDDGPSSAMLSRCKLFLEHPPPANWDYVYTFTEK